MDIRHSWHAVPYVRFLIYASLHCARMPFGYVAKQHIICIVYIPSILLDFYGVQEVVKKFRRPDVFGYNSLTSTYEFKLLFLPVFVDNSELYSPVGNQ